MEACRADRGQRMRDDIWAVARKALRVFERVIDGEKVDPQVLKAASRFVPTVAPMETFPMGMDAPGGL